MAIRWSSFESLLKNRRAIEVHFPGMLEPHLQEYLQIWRPLLAGNIYNGDRLWVSYFHRPQSITSMHGNIARRTDAAFGRGISPQ